MSSPNPNYLKRKKYYRQYYLKNKEKILAYNRKSREKLTAEARKKRKEKIKYFESLELKEAPLLSRPMLANCFRCQKWFLIKYVPWKKRYSTKNDWEYWTEKKENKKICDFCLKDLYLNHKKEYRQSISDFNRRTVLRNYVARQTN